MGTMSIEELRSIHHIPAIILRNILIGQSNGTLVIEVFGVEQKMKHLHGLVMKKRKEEESSTDA
jgi:hypothetical protein